MTGAHASYKVPHQPFSTFSSHLYCLQFDSYWCELYSHFFNAFATYDLRKSHGPTKRDWKQTGMTVKKLWSFTICQLLFHVTIKSENCIRRRPHIATLTFEMTLHYKPKRSESPSYHTNLSEKTMNFQILAPQLRDIVKLWTEVWDDVKMCVVIWNISLP